MFLDPDAIRFIDQWLDDNVSTEYKEAGLAQDWARVSKVIEELGEAIAELILLTGQNPRKQQTWDDSTLLEELSDTALTAILGMQHFTKDTDKTMDVLSRRLARLQARIINAAETQAH